MSFLCPRCRTSLHTGAETTPPDTSQLTCSGCGFVIDLALVDTSAGRPLLPVLPDHSGKQLGSLRLGRCLGAGGMGTVYDARDEETGEQVAVKLLFPHLSAQPDLVERFRREAQALRDLDHPNIVGYRGEGEADGDYYLVMEYIDGVSLGDFLRSGTPTVDQTLDIGEQICAALSAAHEKGIVHRDLKPANVLLSDGVARVVDFGIAHVAAQDVTLTHTDAVLGTFNYMAPEQRTKAARVDARADLFSVGVILYRMLTGELPIGTFEAASRLNPQLSRRHDRLLAKVLHRDPANRHQSAAQLLVELRQLRIPRRRWLPAVAVAAAAAVLVLGGGAVAYSLSQPVGSAVPAAGGEQDTDVEVNVAKTEEVVEPVTPEALPSQASEPAPQLEGVVPSVAGKQNKEQAPNRRATTRPKRQQRSPATNVQAKKPVPEKPPPKKDDNVDAPEWVTKGSRVVEVDGKKVIMGVGVVSPEERQAPETTSRPSPKKAKTKKKPPPKKKRSKKSGKPEPTED